jgi:hypothetical protein
MQCNLVAANLIKVFTIKPDRAFAWPFRKMGKFQKRAFSGTRMPGDKNHFPGLHAEAQIIECTVPARIGFTDAIESQKSHVIRP